MRDRQAPATAAAAVLGRPPFAPPALPPPPRLSVRDSADFIHSSCLPPPLPALPPVGSSSLGKKYSCEVTKYQSVCGQVNG